MLRTYLRSEICDVLYIKHRSHLRLEAFNLKQFAIKKSLKTIQKFYISFCLDSNLHFLSKAAYLSAWVELTKILYRFTKDSITQSIKVCYFMQNCTFLYQYLDKKIFYPFSNNIILKSYFLLDLFYTSIYE